MRRYSESPAIRHMEIIIMGFFTQSQSEWLSYKKKKVVRMQRQGVHGFTPGGYVTIMEDSLRIPQRCEKRSTINTGILFLGIYPKEMSLVYQRVSCFEQLRTKQIDKNQHTPPSIDDWIKETWDMYIILLNHKKFFQNKTEVKFGNHYAFKTVPKRQIPCFPFFVVTIYKYKKRVKFTF